MQVYITGARDGSAMVRVTRTINKEKFHASREVAHGREALATAVEELATEQRALFDSRAIRRTLADEAGRGQ